MALVIALSLLEPATLYRRWPVADDLDPDVGFATGETVEILARAEQRAVADEVPTTEGTVLADWSIVTTADVQVGHRDRIRVGTRMLEVVGQPALRTLRGAPHHIRVWAKEVNT